MCGRNQGISRPKFSFTFSLVKKQNKNKTPVARDLLNRVEYLSSQQTNTVSSGRKKETKKNACLAHGMNKKTLLDEEKSTGNGLGHLLIIVQWFRHEIWQLFAHAYARNKALYVKDFKNWIIISNILSMSLFVSFDTRVLSYWFLDTVTSLIDMFVSTQRTQNEFWQMNVGLTFVGLQEKQAQFLFV